MVSNIKIGFATDSMTFTPTEAFSYSNGYDYFFPNGQELASVIEENTPSIATGFSYGSTPRTNTFKATASGSMAQIKVLEKYTHIAVYKDGSLVFCGYNPTFSKTIKKGVGAQGTDESYVVAQMSFSDYSGSLKDVTFSSSEEFDLYYTSSDNIKVCNPSDTSHSLIHILLGYLDPNHRFTVHFGNMPSILKNTKVTYFSVTYEDKVLSIIKDVLEQAGLAMYFDRMHIYIIDVLEELSGTAINIPDIESDAVKKGRSFVEISIPTILMATARFVTDVTVYDSGEMSVSGDDWYYPAEDTLAEGSFSYSAKEDDEKEKRYFNFREKDFYGEHGLLGYGNDLVYFSRTSTGLKYRVKNDSALRRKFRLKQKADVLLFKYATAFTPTENWNKEESECDYIYSNEMAQRYANALMYQKKSQAVYIDFYADTTSQYPNGYPINSVISLQGTDEVNPLFLITTKTDKLDPFGGYTYRAIPYDRGNVQLSSNYVESKEGLPQYDGKFTAYVSRDVIVCHSNHTPKDTTPVQVVVNIKDRTVVPVLTVNGNEVAIQREQVPVITEGGTEYADTDNWIYEIEANLFGYDTCQLKVAVGDESWSTTLSKSADVESVAPDIIVPEGYTLVTQFCYGTEHNPDPRWVEDASYTLEDASFLVSDIYWVDAVDGECPLRPRVGMYIWMRQGVYDPNEETEPSTWTISLYDTPLLKYEFTVSHNSYIKDDRLAVGYTNTIYIYPDIMGYDISSLHVTASNVAGNLPYDSENMRFVLTFPKSGAPTDGVTITATLGTKQWSVVLACDNLTEYGHDYSADGTMYASAPTSPPPVYEVGRPTDTYLATNGVTYEYKGSWVECNDASKLIANLKRLIDNPNVDLKTLSDPNTTSFFKRIIADELYVATLNAIDALFTNIHVTGTSQFDGQIVNDAMTTFPAHSGTISLNLKTTNTYVKNKSTGLTSSYASPQIKISDLENAFPTYGTYVASSGKLQFIDSTGTTQTYTASSSNQIAFIYQNNYLEIQRNGATLVKFGESITQQSGGGGSVTFVPIIKGLLVTSHIARLYSDTNSFEGGFITYVTNGTDNLEIGGYAGYSEMGNVIPKVDNTHFLGTNQKQWSQIFGKEIFENNKPVLSTNKIVQSSFDQANKTLPSVSIGELGLCVGKKSGSLTVTLPSSGSYNYSALSTNCYFNGANGVQVRTGENTGGGTNVSLGNSDAGKPYGVIFLYWKVAN